MDKVISLQIREAKAMSKNSLARNYVDAANQLSVWVEVCITMAAYYYNIEPHADIFNGPTFNPGTLERIKKRAPLARKDVPYARVVYVVDLNPDEIKAAVPVEVVDVTVGEQWDDLFNKLNDDREKFLQLDRDDPPVNCRGCQFWTSCNNSMLRTGLRVYDCAQFAPNNPQVPKKGGDDGDN